MLKRKSSLRSNKKSEMVKESSQRSNRSASRRKLFSGGSGSGRHIKTEEHDTITDAFFKASQKTDEKNEVAQVPRMTRRASLLLSH